MKSENWLSESCKIRWFFVAFFCILFLGGRSEALPEYLQVAKQTYAFKPAGEIAAKKCQLCHTQATNANSLNFYGKSVQSALNAASAETLTPALLHTLDKQDPDGDGFDNLSEFRADTLPGDPLSHPKGAPAVAISSKLLATATQAEMNPFDPKKALLAKHAQHPVMVHFPIALFLFSLFLDVLGRMRNSADLQKAALVNLLGATVMGGISLLTGLIAWQLKFGGLSAPISDNRWLYIHLGLGIATVILLSMLSFIRIKGLRKGVSELSIAYLVLATVAAITIALAGHLGGVVSGVS